MLSCHGEVFANLRKTLLRVAPLLFAIGAIQAQIDPGPRGGAAAAGGPIAGLTDNQTAFFNEGQGAFGEVDAVPDGLGPRFNLNSCGGCHAAPATGGSSPALNPQVAGNVAPASQVATLTALGLISANGPVREVRFKSDGGVHDLFTIVGLPGAPAGCNISQPNFAGHATDIIFRIPTPVFGDGLIEAITDATIRANLASNALAKSLFGISGHVNTNGNDGTVTRFGWKAQNKSVVIFAGEAYNVEQGISNELFPDERGEGGIQDPGACYTPKTNPNDQTNFDSPTPVGVPSDVIAFADFMRFLAPPTPSCTVGVNCSASATLGSTLFSTLGCALCHTPSLQTGNHPVAALNNQTARLFSDLAVHNMGSLGDGISQGTAGPNEFRTAPLWGVGQRVFFLHDGRTSDLVAAIEAHANGGKDAKSEARTSIVAFNLLDGISKQAIVDFLRTL